MEEIVKINHYEFDDLLDTFAIKETEKCMVLDEWLDVSGELNDFENKLLNLSHQRMAKNVKGWNEEELKINFLGNIFLLADIEIEGVCKTFFERPLSAIIDNKQLSVKCDCLVASVKGKSTPKYPYFFLQEFKKQKGDSNDPEAQMLAAMIIAQSINKDENPLYGCWLQGKNWNFSVLNGKDYCTSKQFDTLEIEDLYQVLFILRNLKKMILKNLKH